MRRFRRLFRRLRQSGAGRRERSVGAARRHRDPVGNAGDLWRRTSVDAPRGQPRGRAKKLVALMRWWEEYTEREGAEMNANPSPETRPGGLTTILEKSLGAMAKAGSTNLVDVVNYAEAVTKKGFVFMDTPATTRSRRPGRWRAAPTSSASPRPRSVFGCKPAPSIKLATTRRCTSAWKTTWTSIAAPSSTARKPCSNAASAFST